ncbi:SAM-dependent methyltransferase [Oceanicoccus sp. KOV_DT_Chl]|uniref:SAM-dependent methyltransferase n=1 Tax=Oceanicoccus sp. KOV_DT_Chl TaxID=1904639 RepID=UPI000C7E4234|nr:SAM-dependent methyltransferase [Oceanicoccus sp. KOV_DT_Chl]
MGDSSRFTDIGFDDFRTLATDESLSKYEKIGFPDSYRDGFESHIFDDICQKLTNLKSSNSTVIDIGPGCSDLPLMLIESCKKLNNSLVLIDSEEMLKLLPDNDFIDKVAALYPNCPELFTDYAEKVDVILCYSVLHYIIVDSGFFRFLDLSLSLLAPGGQMLIGDIPNISMRKRFFSSATGVRFHKDYMQTDDKPDVIFNNIEHDQIDDSVLFLILQRARMAGFDAFLLPQNPLLPMSNRREDILIRRP